MPGLRQDAGPRLGPGCAPGIVEAVGSAVTELRPGDEVMGIAEGTFAELAVARPEKLVPKPARLTLRRGGGRPDLRAHRAAGRARRDAGPARAAGAGDRRRRGRGHLDGPDRQGDRAPRSPPCAARRRRSWSAPWGPTRSSTTPSEDFADGTRTWDAIIDNAGRRPLRHLRRALAPRGSLGIVGGDGGGRWTGGFFRQILRAPLLSLVSRQRLRPVVSHGEPGRPAGAGRAARGRLRHPGGQQDLPAGRRPRGGPGAGARPRARQARDHRLTLVSGPDAAAA